MHVSNLYLAGQLIRRKPDGESDVHTPRGGISPSTRANSAIRVSASFLMKDMRSEDAPYDNDNLVFADQSEYNEKTVTIAHRSIDGRDVTETIAPGLTVLIGGPGSGKTTLASSMMEFLKQQDMTGHYVRFHEPETNVFGDLLDLAETVDLAMDGQKPDFLIIDSLREFMFRTSGGAAGAAGSNPTLGNDLAIWHQQARAAGLIVIVVLNPVVSDDRVVDALVQSTRAGIHASILAKNGTYQIGSRVSRELSTPNWVFPVSGDYIREQEHIPVRESKTVVFDQASAVMESNFADEGSLPIQGEETFKFDQL